MAVPDAFNGGTPIKVVGGANLLCNFNNAPEVYVQGAPYVLSGALCSTGAGSVTGFSQGGLPLVAGGEIAVDAVAAITSYNAGLPYTAEGRLALAIPE